MHDFRPIKQCTRLTKLIYIYEQVYDHIIASVDMQTNTRRDCPVRFTMALGNNYHHYNIHLIFMQVKGNLEASVLCLTTIGTVKLSLRYMDDVKVCIITL
jgi:hypothetical protein